MNSADDESLRQILTQVKQLDELRNQANKLTKGNANGR